LINFVDKFRPIATIPIFEKNLGINLECGNKVLHIATDTSFGGVERMILGIAENRSIAKCEHDFFLCFNGLLYERLIKIRQNVSLAGPVSFRNPFSVMMAKLRLKKLLADRRPDVLVCHGEWVFRVFGATIRKAGVRLALMMHSIPGKEGYLDCLTKFKANLPDIALANSLVTLTNAKTFRKKYKTLLCYPVCLLGNVSQRCDLRKKVRAQLGIAASKRVILSAGRFEEWKGYSVLIEAVDILRGKYDLVILIASKPRGKYEKEFYNRLTEKCKQSHLCKIIHWLGHQDYMDGLYAAADVYCQPNLSPESFGMTFVEAQAMGCPVVTTKIGGALETVEENGINKLIEKSDPDLVAKSVSEIFDNVKGAG
jgi:glycosyltransferase involved in cell wall biosynthesis